LATLLEIRNAVLSNTGRSGSGTGNKSSEADKGINLALLELARRQDWKDLRTSVIGSTLSADTATVTIPTDSLRLVEVRWVDTTNETGDTIKLGSKEEVLKAFPTARLLTSAKPLTGYEEGGLIYLVPVADGTYQVEYTYLKRPSTLTLDADTPDINDVEDLLEYYATWYVFQNIQRTEDADRYLGMFNALLADAESEDSKRPAQNHMFKQWTRRSQSVFTRDPNTWYGTYNG